MATFLSLPRELRDQIYGLVLTTESGILLSMTSRFIPSTITYTNYRIKGRDYALAKREIGDGLTVTDEPDSESVDECALGEPLDESALSEPLVEFPLPATVSSWLPTSILYTSRQVSAEALETLYSTNDFIPNCPLERLNDLLLNLPPSLRAQIRSLDFPKRSLMPLQYPNVTAWRTLLGIIAHQTQITTVKLNPPLEPSMYVPSPALLFRTSFGEETQFWWPAAQALITLLQDPAHSLRAIQLIYPTLLRPGGSARQVHQIRRAEKFEVEELNAVRTLRVPRRPRDETPEQELFEKMIESKVHGSFTRSAWKNYFAEAERQGRVKHHFTVELVEDEGRDDVTLVLRPGAASRAAPDA